ncbi:MAG: DoxX family protein [Hyphomonadaceae bacterium]|nr:DoxX family protein [Hyphomonadaceae bacterium]
MTALQSSLDAWQPRVLSVLRIIAGLLFLQHGLVKLFGFPMAFPNPVANFSMLWFAAAIEIVGGALLIVGLFTRWVAFVSSGLMAFAYFIGHYPRAFYPIQNGGNLAILYCFVFFYLIFAGPGPWSLDARRATAA